MKSIYPALTAWMEETGMTDGALMDVLYLSPFTLRNRLIGRTPFALIEQEKLERMSGIPAAELLRKEGE